jgi:cytochrome c-type biogenesis protein CcsB|tara:strand:- start:770 stop:1744 length:975 start_codon:yes stop_codon:yes gene_type:complete
MNIQSNLDNLIFANLLFVTIIYWASLVFPKFKFLSKLGFYGNCCASSCLFILLGSRWLISGYFPLSNLYESLMFLAWGITSLSAFIENRTKISIIGSISTPIALFVTGFASLSLPEVMQAPSSLVPALKSNWLMMHVTVMMLSYASLLVGSLLSIFFLVLANNKKEKVSIQGNSYGDQSTSNFRLTENIAFYQTETTQNYSNLLSDDNTVEPNVVSSRLTLLESIDNLSYRTISFGFPLLTIGIIAGAVWANEAWGSYWSWDPKETWALITWLVFASYLHARITKSWQGEKPALVASVGFVVVWICYLGVNFLGKGLHTYGQIL